ncbi:MAG TPA: hypothetical protein VG253_13965 [Streptosporangiaceae bacterium]|nr:hypothetical protein [Streptosporangiaceae bacterium]
MREDRAGRQVVQFGVGKLPAALGDVGQERGDEVFGEPAQRYDWSFCRC